MSILSSQKLSSKDQEKLNLDKLVLPSKSQFAYQEAELAAFMHFSVNTFTGREWGTGEEDPNVFNPSKFNPDGMVKAIKEAGFSRLIITAKHHDGFCLWFTDATNHSVEHTKFHRDVLKELSAACTKYDLDMGIYLSPWDAHEPSYGYGEGYNEETDTNGDYNEFYLQQILEICKNPQYGNKGKFVEWWLDGAKGEGADAQEYDFETWIKTIRKYNPGINIFGAGVEGGIHWVLNENGFAPEPCYYTVTKVPGAENNLEQDPQGEYWSVPEADVSIYKGWFHHENDKTKTQSELAYIYLNSIGRGSTLLINLAPSQEGDFTPELYETLDDFHEAVSTINKPVLAAENKDLTTSSEMDLDYKDYLHCFENEDRKPEIIFEFDQALSFDLISIGEAIEFGQKVEEFSLELEKDTGEFIHIFHGTTIGHKRIILLDKALRDTKFKSLKFRFKLLEGKGPLVLSFITLNNLAKKWQDPQSAEKAPLPGVEPGDPEW